MNKSYIEETQLATGPLVVSHAMPEAQSVALGIFVDVGSRDETVAQAGITHALEHMLFKGTRELDVHQLAIRLDALGGNANAYTSRERTCFHLHVLHEQWREALGLLSSMVLEPALPAAEWQRERDVIISEMAMVDDTPEEWVMDQHVTALFAGQAVGQPVLGTPESLGGVTRDDLAAYLGHWYRPPRMLIAAAGRIDHAELVEAVANWNWPAGAESAGREKARICGGVQVLARDFEQAQLVLSLPGIVATSEARPQAWIANQILGGGMSSRLFSEVREKRGLAYSVGSHLSMLTDTGSWTVTCGTSPEHAGSCVDLIGEVLGRLPDSLDEAEVARARQQLEVQLRMGMDSVEGQMLYLGGRLDEAKLLTPMQWIERIRTVDVDTLRDWIGARLAEGRLWTVAAPEAALAGICDRLPQC
ncbi:MAG TPA: pitrilysin family protein [Mariprofundaceae bacterium]|nr:pitrilysin family protein [Mariprofundaceae bacterium]